MKKMIYFIIYAILQIGFGIHCFFTAEEYAAEELKNTDLSVFPKEFADVLNLKTLTTSYQVLFCISVIIGLILLVLVLKNKKLEKNGLTIGLLIGSFFTTVDIPMLLSIVSLILVFADKSSGKKKIKKVKKIPEIINLKTTKKDYISGIVLVLVYAAQYLFIPLLYFITKSEMFASVSYEIVIFAVAIWAFAGRYKRDFKYLKSNLSAYVKNAFKYWGLMLLVVLGVGLLEMALGVESESANQALLKTLPLLYLLPATIIWAPVVEEAIFRGVFRRFIKNDVLFIIISAISFGLLHTFSSEVGLYNIIVQSLSYAAMGGVMAYAYTKTNNIFTSMMVHSIQNTFGMIMIILTTFM